MTAKKSIKDKFTEHYLIFGATLIIIGFSSGFGAKEYFFGQQIGEQKGILSFSADEMKLRASHNESLSIIYKELASQENGAGQSVYLLDRGPHLESADRLRADINNEHKIFESSLKIIRCDGQ